MPRSGPPCHLRRGDAPAVLGQGGGEVESRADATCRDRTASTRRACGTRRAGESVGFALTHSVVPVDDDTTVRPQPVRDAERIEHSALARCGVSARSGRQVQQGSGARHRPSLHLWSRSLVARIRHQAYQRCCKVRRLPSSGEVVEFMDAPMRTMICCGSAADKGPFGPFGAKNPQRMMDAAVGQASAKRIPHPALECALPG